MNIYLTPAQQDFNDYTNNLVAFQNRIANLNNMFGLNANNGLMANVLPTYHAGNLLNPKYIIIGINPGLNQGNINFENQHRTQNWNAYRNFHDNFFNYYLQNNRQIRYYSYMAGVLAPNNIRYNNWSYFNYCHNAILNIDIIPYHSHGFHKRHINNNAHNYILNRFNNEIIPLLARNQQNVNRVIIHDSRLFVLLLNNGFMTNQNIVYHAQTNNGLRMIYSVNYQGIEFRLFSRFIPNGGFSRQIVQQYI